MKLSDMAMLDPEEEGAEDVDADGAAVFEDAASEAFEAAKAGDKGAFSAALKSAVEACVADYMSEE